MQNKPATCPHCRARLGLRTLFACGDLWDSRVRSLGALALEFRCYACARALRYPINTIGSFIALAVSGCSWPSTRRRASRTLVRSGSAGA